MDDSLIPPGLPGEDSESRSEYDPILERALALTKERQAAEPVAATPQANHESDPILERALALTKERRQKEQETKSARQAVVNHLYVQSSDQTPESYAEAMRLGKTLNRPAGLIALDMDNYRAMAGNQKIAAVAERSPNVTRFLGKRENAILAAGDTDLLEKIEWESRSWAYKAPVKVVDFFRSIPAGAVRAAGSGMSGIGHMLDALDQERVENLTALGHDPDKLNPGGLGDLANAVFGTDFSSTGDMLKQGADPTKKAADWIAVPQYRRGFTDDAGEAVGQVVGQIATALITRGYGTTAMTFGQGADQQVDEAKAVGKTPQLVEMFLGGMSTMVTEKLGRDLITGGVKALPKSLQNRATTAFGGYPVVMAGEGLSEGLDQLFQNTIASVRTNPDKDLTEGVAYSALLGAIAGGVVHGGIRLVESRLNQQQAKTEQDGLSTALDTLANTKMYQLAPDKAGEAFAQTTGVDALHVDAAVFNQTVLQSGQDWAQPLLDNAALMEQVQTAAAAGETVAIPSRDLIAHVPMETLKTLLPDMHIRPDGVTPRIAERDYEVATQEYNQRMETALANLESGSMVDPIYADVEAQLRNAGLKDKEAAADATLISERYTTRAARLSAELGYEIDPVDLYRQDSLRINGGNAAPGQFNQALENYLPAGMVKGGGEDLAALYRGEAREDGARAIFLGPTSGKLLTDIPALEDFSHSVDNSMMKHVMSHHGDAKSEARRGLVPITDKDVAAIPDIITTYDAIRYDLVSKRGDPLVAYAKVVDDGVLIYLEEVRNGRKDMAGLSLWKKRPTATSAPDVLQHAVSESYVRNDGRHKGMVVKNTDDFYKKLQREKTGLPEILNIDGIDRPTTNSSGALIAQTEDGIRNFWRWFGRSKAVDDKGRPLVVYHGTTADIEAFDPSKANENTYLGGTENTVFLSDNPDVASSYAGRRTNMTGLEESYAAGSNVVPVYLKIDKPLKANAKGEGWQDIQYKGDFYSTADLASLAQESGKDGAIISRVVDYRDKGATGKSEENTTKPSTTFVVFDPTQIKSAVGNRGTFDPADPRILYHNTDDGIRANVAFTESGIDVRLFKAANASSFLHESGHIFLKQLTDDVALIQSQPGYDPAKPGKLEQDLRSILDWMGAKDAQSITTEQHETFARGTEKYFREGKAPSSALRRAFNQFRQWLTRIYRRADALDVELSPEIRGVMDRMVAVDSEIAAMKEQSNRLKEKPADLTDKEWADYQAAQDEADLKLTETVTQWSLADLDPLNGGGVSPLKQLRDAISNQVDAEMKTLPVWQAVRLIRGGDGQSGPLPLNRDEVRRIAGQAALMALESKRNGNLLAAVGKDGVHPQDIADAAGYPTAEALLKDLAGLPSKADYRQQAVQAVLAERFGAFSEDNLPQAVQAALLNQEQVRKLEQEYRILSRQRSSADTAARQLARTTLAQQHPNQARDFSKHLRASLRAGREADKAWGQGDRETAIKAKERQIMAHALARESRKIGQEMDKAQRYLRMLLTSKQARLNIGNEAMAQIDALLMQADVPRPDKFTPLEATESLDAWQARMADLGYDAVDTAPPKPLLIMMVGQVRDFVDLLKHIDHVGRTENKLLLEGESESVAEAAGEMANGVRISKPQPLQRSGALTPTAMDSVKDSLGSLNNLMLRPEKAMEFYDSGDVNGAFHRKLWRPLKQAQYAKADRMKVLMERVNALMETRRKENPKGIDKSRYRIADRDMTHDHLLAIGLNLGNLDNKTKLMNGYQWDEAVISEVKSKLTKADWDFIQGMWDTFETLYPELSKIEAKVNGKGLPKVESAPVNTVFGTYRGGYYPLVYDPRNPSVYGRNMKDEGKLDLANISGVVIAPRHSSRKTRVDNVNLPILLDPSLAIKGLESSVHDITHTIPVMNARKLLNHGGLQGAMVDYYGIDSVKTLQGWLNAISLDKTQDDPVRVTDRWLKSIRMRATVVALGYRLSTIVAQLGGIPQAMAYLGPKAVVRGFAKVYLNNWGNITAAWDQCNQMSGEFRHRNTMLDRDVRENMARLRGKNDPTDIIKKHAFAGIATMDKVMSLGIWHGAFDQHLDNHPGDLAGAIAYADGAITKTQGSGAVMDLAPLMRMNEWAKLFTMFYTPFSAAYGQTSHIVRDLRYGNGKAKARAFQSFMLLSFSYILPDLLMGRFPDDDDDESVLWWAAKKAAFGNLGILPLARDVAQEWDTGFTGTTAPVRIAKSVGRGVIAPFKAAGDDDYDWLDASIDIAESATYVSGIPVGQPVSSLRSWKQQEDGKHDESVRGILFGNRR